MQRVSPGKNPQRSEQPTSSKESANKKPTTKIETPSPMRGRARDPAWNLFEVCRDDNGVISNSKVACKFCKSHLSKKRMITGLKAHFNICSKKDNLKPEEKALVDHTPKKYRKLMKSAEEQNIMPSPTAQGLPLQPVKLNTTFSETPPNVMEPKPNEKTVIGILEKSTGDSTKALSIANKLAGAQWGVSDLKDLFELTTEDLLEACPQLLSRVTARRIIRLCKEHEISLKEG